MSAAPTIRDVERRLAAEYAGVFDARQARRHVADYVGLGLAADLVELVRRRVAPGASVLDVGCGYGSFVLAARNAGYDGVGVDLAEFELDFARGRLRAERPEDDAAVVYRREDALRLGFADDAFDAVTLWNVLEHVREPARALAEAARVLRPGGALFAIAPNYASFRREAHYHVPWAPFLSGRLAERYLRLLGRDPRFFANAVHPVTNRQVLRALRRLGMRVEDPRVWRLEQPESIGRAPVRRGVEAARRVGAAGAVRRLMALELESPVRPMISLVAVKETPGRGAPPAPRR